MAQSNTEFSRLMILSVNRMITILHCVRNLQSDVDVDASRHLQIVVDIDIDRVFKLYVSMFYLRSREQMQSLILECCMIYMFASSNLILFWMWLPQSLDLGREPYQIELDEAVEKEIAAVLLKNEERKKKKRNDVAMAPLNSAVNKEFEDRILLMEDTVEKWEERMDDFGSMLSKMYEAQFGKKPSRVQDERKNKRTVSQKVEAAVFEKGEKSGDEEGSSQSPPDDDSSDGSSSNEEEDYSAGKSTEVPLASAKEKGKNVQDAQGQPVVGSIAIAAHKSGSVARTSEPGRPSASNSEKIPKVCVL